MRQVPKALPRLQQLTHLAYAGGFRGGCTDWVHELLASTATLTGLRALHLSSSPHCGGALAEAFHCLFDVEHESCTHKYVLHGDANESSNEQLCCCGNRA